MYSNEQVEKIKKALEDSKVEELLEEANDRFVKLIGELGDEVDLRDILDDGIIGLSERSMYISKARVGKEGKPGYALEFVGGDGDLLVEGAYRLAREGTVGVGLVEKIREMAYMGYRLCQGKKDKVIDVFRDLDL